MDGNQEKTQEKSCGIVLFREPTTGEREYLIVHYRAGHWSLVKGHVEGGESEEQTARREAREETGLSLLRLRRGFKFRIHYTHSRGNGRVDKQVVFFLARVPGGKRIRLSNEHPQSAWLAFPDAKKRLTYDSDRRVLEAAELFLS